MHCCCIIPLIWGKVLVYYLKTCSGHSHHQILIFSFNKLCVFTVPYIFFFFALKMFFSLAIISTSKQRGKNVLTYGSLKMGLVTPRQPSYNKLLSIIFRMTLSAYISEWYSLDFILTYVCVQWKEEK